MTNEESVTITDGKVTATFVSTGQLSNEEYETWRKGFIRAVARAAARRDHQRYIEGQVQHRKQVLTPAGGVCKWRRKEHRD